MKSSIAIHGARAAVLSLGLAACLTRPLVAEEPQENRVYVSETASQVVDKIDLLFDVDNSRSMGDKQQYLAAAIPDLVNRLLNPNCVDANGVGTQHSDAGVCPSGLTPEFHPVHDMHLGIVTSSLGTRLSNEVDKDGSGVVCPSDANAANGQAGWPFANISAHNDDQGHLVARSLTYDATGANATEGSVGDAAVTGYAMGSGFLAWAPSGSGVSTPPGGPPAVTDATTLVSDLTSMVSGAGAYGCGIESQLESWYRFLIQPDPYSSLGVVGDPGSAAAWQSVDAEILRERRDFLRPDSLVAVIVLSDENDSEIDVRSYSGTGYYFMGANYHPAKATSACATDPAAPGCEPCTKGSTDPACAPPDGGGVPSYSNSNDWGMDPNLRHVHMKEKYGADPQFPIQRYAIGLSSATVPDRAGEYPQGAGQYVVGNNDCTNPLFAASLPDGSDTSPQTLCKLQPGTRTRDLVFYAVIGGVPHELLHYTPGDPVASTLTQDDWVRILGQGPASTTMDASKPPSFDYSGIDPHMIEDYRDRQATSYPFRTDATLTLGAGSNGAASLTPSSAASNADPVNGREWITDQPLTAPADGGHPSYVDLQYACIFKLAQPRDCTQSQNRDACDCPTHAGALTHAQTPPLCDDNTPTLQLYAKAYPTPRELMVAKLLGQQGVVASLCPQDPVDLGTPDQPDPYYGYSPAIASLVDRLKVALGDQCLPEPVTFKPDTDEAPCLILVTLPESVGGSCANPICDPSKGFSVPSAEVQAQFCSKSDSPATRSVCVLKQLTPSETPSDFMSGTCGSESNDPGWCYVKNTKRCAQAIEFSNGALPSGSTAALQCLE